MKTRPSKKIAIPVLVLIALIVHGATCIKAAPADLDPTFGNGGVVITDGSNTLDRAADMAIQADGKIVLVGEGGDGGPTYDFAVVRYNTDGSLDTSFGGTGIVITPFGGGSFGAVSVAIQANGKIVVLGNSNNGSQTGLAVARYNPNGLLDTSFNGTGIVVTQTGITGFTYAGSVAIQADDKIVATGTRDDGFMRIALVRYNTDGTLDTTLNGSGIVITTIHNSFCEAKSVAIQSDGKIVVAGSGFGFEDTQAYAVVRYNTNGSLDSSFNGTGIVTTQIGNAIDEAQSVAIQTDGKIVVGGRSVSMIATSRFAFVRYSPNGSLDTSFGGTGKVIIPIGYSFDVLSSLAIQADGKIVACGGNQTYPGFVVVRLNPNGSLDTTFGGTGKIISCIGYGCGGAASVAIQADGRIVVAGTAAVDLDDLVDFAVVRYQGGSDANIRTRFDFDGDGRADISVFRPTDSVWYLNRSTAGFSATQFGLSTDKITPSDFDGDGKTDIAVYRPFTGIWYVFNSGNGTLTYNVFGSAEDLPTPADYDGDGKADISVFRPSEGTWYRQNSSNGQLGAIHFGQNGDVPIIGDYDADGQTDFTVFRPSNGYWYIYRSSDDQFQAVAFGLNGDIPLSGDFNGDGRSDLAVFRPSDGTWYIARPTGIPGQNFDAIQFGLSTDIPTPGDYDGDGKADVAVYREGVWYLLQSTGGLATMQFGLANDKPIPAAYQR